MNTRKRSPSIESFGFKNSNAYGCLDQEACSKHTHSKNCQNNPLCLFGLGESKEGIWAKRPSIIANLENNPPEIGRVGVDRHSSSPQLDYPVGLTNLGATCYVNVLLQTLFACLPFRSAIYHYPGGGSATGTNGAIVLEIQRVFAFLDPRNVAASCSINDLIDLLKFDKSYQQDPIECWKLLSAPIDNAFNATGDPKLMGFFDREFRGSQKYVTTCTVCRRTSEREEVIEELQLQIKGNSSVVGCLELYEGEEKLQGGEQYQCDTCGRLTDATRQIVVTKLPQVLWVQLLRYEYNKFTYEKEKLNDSIALDETVDMSQHFKTFDIKKRDQVYSLASVVEHQGQGASSGHYVARVRHPSDPDIWWVLDDDKVSKDSQVTEVVDTSDDDDTEDADPAPKKKSKGGKKKAAKKAAKKKVADQATPDSLQNLGMKKSRRSKDCYILVYLARSQLEQLSIPCPPDHLLKEIEQRNVRMASLLDEHDLKVVQLKNLVAERKQWYSKHFHTLVPGAGDQFVFVDADWLKEWVTGVNAAEGGKVATSLFMNLPPPSITCEHSNEFLGHHASPAEAVKLKKVNLVVLQSMLLLHHTQGVVDETCSSLLCGDRNSSWFIECNQCASLFRDKCEANDLKEELYAKIQGGVDQPDSPFLISRSWLTSLKNGVEKKKQRKGDLSDFVVVKDNADPTVNSKVICDHGRLMPSCAVRPISTDGWIAVKELFPEAMELHQQDRCPECVEHSRDMSGMRKEDKAKRLQHLSGELGKLHKRTKPILFKDVSTAENLKDEEWVVVKRHWVHKWRNWVNGNIGDSEHPPPSNLGSAEQLRCPCGLIVLPVYLDAEAVLLPDSAEMDGFELISSLHYSELMLRCKSEEGSEVKLSVMGSDPFQFKWSHDICVQCSRKARDVFQAESYNFTHKPLSVVLLSEGATLPDQENPSALSRPRRQSRNSSNQPKTLPDVSSSDKVGLLKVKIWQLLDGLEPQKMQLFVNGAVLGEDNKQLSFYNVHAASTVYVKSIPAANTLDYYLGFWTQTSQLGDVAREVGFSKTALFGGLKAECPFCTGMMSDSEDCVIGCGQCAHDGRDVIY